MQPRERGRRVLRGSQQLAHLRGGEIATLGEPVKVILVRRVLLALVVQEESQVGGEESLQQRLAIEQFVGGHVDTHHELEPEEGLAQGAPDRGFDEFRPLTAHGCSGSVDCFPSQAIQGCHRRFFRQQRGNVGLDVAEGMSLGQPAQDQLGRRERGLNCVDTSL